MAAGMNLPAAPYLILCRALLQQPPLPFKLELLLLVAPRQPEGNDDAPFQYIVRILYIGADFFSQSRTIVIRVLALRGGGGIDRAFRLEVEKSAVEVGQPLRLARCRGIVGYGLQGGVSAPHRLARSRVFDPGEVRRFETGQQALCLGG